MRLLSIFLALGASALVFHLTCGREAPKEALFPQPFASPALAEAKEILDKIGIESEWKVDGQGLLVAPLQAPFARAALTTAVLPRLGAPHPPVVWSESRVRETTEALQASLLATDGVREAKVRVSVPRGVPAVPSVRVLLDFSPETDPRKLAFGIVNTVQAMVVGCRVDSIELQDLRGNSFSWWPKSSGSRLSDSDLIELLSSEAVSKLEAALEERLGCRVSVQLTGEIVFEPGDSIPAADELAADIGESLSLAGRCLSVLEPTSTSSRLELDYEERLARLAHSAKLQKRQVWVLVEAESLEDLEKAKQLAEQQLKIERALGETLEAVEAEFEP